MITDAGAKEFKPYVYRGTGKDTITGHWPDDDAVARPAAAAADGRCVACGYKVSGRNHKTMCGA